MLHYLKVWFAAARPHTLSAAAVPVLVGSALAFSKESFAWPLFGWTLLGSLLVQVGTNFTDEFSDHHTVAAGHKFPAPHKVIARGLLSVRAVCWGTAVVFGAASLIGMYLVSRTGWPLLAVCLVSLVVAYFYSAGPLPLGDIALGEVLVFAVMGPLMVMSTVYVQTLHWDMLAFWLALPVGGLVTAILVANNLRDAEEDRTGGRRTVVTVFGVGTVGWGYRALLLLAFAMPGVAVGAHWGSFWLLLPWLTLPLAFRQLVVLRAGLAAVADKESSRSTLHSLLKGTSALHLLFGLLLALALVLDAS